MRQLKAVTQPESTTGLDGCQEALMCSRQVNSAQANTLHWVLLHYIRIQSHTCVHTYKHEAWKQHKETRGSGREQGRETMGGEFVGEGNEEKSVRRGGEGGKKKREKKKSLSSFRPSRPPVAFQPVSFTGLGKWSTAASLTYIVCIMLLLELPGHGEGCWTLICIKLHSPIPPSLSLSFTTSWALPFSTAKPVLWYTGAK